MLAACQHPSVVIATDRKRGGQEEENRVVVVAVAADSDGRRRNSSVSFISLCGWMKDGLSARFDLRYTPA